MEDCISFHRHAASMRDWCWPECKSAKYPLNATICVLQLQYSPQQGLAILLFSFAAADNFMSELEKLKGNAGFDSFDSQKVDLAQSLDDKRVKRFPQFTHFGAPASPYAPAPAPYTPAVYAPEPYVAPVPAPG